jgi:4-amino-4-deoxy-L-arabinose transferase-like glycosyltransferase
MNLPATPRRFAPLSIIFCGVLLVAAWTGLELGALGRVPFHTKGEPREALVVWEMTHGGGWILPRRNGVELPSKPPLFHWLGAVTSYVRGSTDEWSIRFPSAALSLVALLCVFATGTALWSLRAGFVSAVCLMTTFEWARAATGARVDMTLTFGLQLALLSLLFFLRSRRAGWLVPLYVGIALAVLGKGPVGAVLPGLVTLVMLAVTRDTGMLGQLRLGWGAVTVSIAAGSWYVMALILGGWAFFRKQVLAENVFTFLEDPEVGTALGAGGHRHSAGYLLGALLLGLLPWTLFLPGMAARLWRRRRELSPRDPRSYLLIWVGVVFGFYAIAASKRSVYLLGLYPAVALLLGWWWDEQSRTSGDEGEGLAMFVRGIAWMLRAIVALVFVAVLLESLGAPLSAWIQPWLPLSARPFAPWVGEAACVHRWLLLGLLLGAVGALSVTIWAARAVHWIGIFIGMCCTVGALIVAVNQVVLPGIARHQSMRNLMNAARQLIGPEGDLFFYKAFDYGAVFYWQGHIPPYEGPFPDGAPRYVLMQEEEWKRLQPAVGDAYERVTLADDENRGEHGPLVLVRRIGEQ